MMKLDLILLNVTKNVDDEVSVKGSPTSNAIGVPTGTGSGSPSNSNTSTIVRTLQNLSESIQCYSAASYLENSSHEGIEKSDSSSDHQDKKESQHSNIPPAHKQQQSDTATRLPGTRGNKGKKNSSTSGKKSNSVSLTPSLASDEKNMIAQSQSSTSSCLINEDVMATIGKQVLKYIKTSDRYMCLASCLLKSRAFHETYPNLSNRPQRTRRSCMSPPASTTISNAASEYIVSSDSKLSSSNDAMTVKESAPSITNQISPMTTADTELSLNDEMQPGQKTLRRPLINLPRTKHGKPYIPVTVPSAATTPTSRMPSPTNTNNSPSCSTGPSTPTTKDEENAFPLSVSHQYPYVGMIRINENPAQQSIAPTTGTSSKARAKQRKRGSSIDTKNSSSGNLSKFYQGVESVDMTELLLVGFDIVVFDEINYRLYDTVQDYVDVFRGMFSPSEFKILHDSCSDNPEKQLRELYLRWAVKEAYTKALGVGLGYDFSTFQVILDLQANSQSSSRASNKEARQSNDYFLWEWLCWVISDRDSKSYSTSPSSTVYPKVYGVTGTIQQTIGKSKSNEHYAFFFCPLSNDERFWPMTQSSSPQPAPLQIATTVATTIPTTSSIFSTTAMSELVGCACACVGPLNVLSPAVDLDEFGLPTAKSFKKAAIAAMNKIECSVEWTDLEHLISWHSSLEK
jgi:phosphopantetheine--protein transferase-like protein